MKTKAFPPKPERSWEDGEDSLPRVWALLARPERDDTYPSYSGGYRHLKFDIVSVIDTYHDNEKKIRNPGTDAMSDLEFYSQGDQFDPDRLYGYRLQYARVHHTDLYKLSAMHAFLTAYERRMAALKQQHGSAPDYAHYMVRAAQVLKVQYVISQRKDGGGWTEYDRGDYKFVHLMKDGKFDGETLLYRVQRLIVDLWTESDRTKAAAYQAEKEAWKATVA